MSKAAPSAKPQVLWRRPVVLRLLIIAFLGELGYAILNISTMPVYLASPIAEGGRNLGEGAVGWVVSAFLLSETIFKSPMGHLADRVGRRTLMVVGPLLTMCTALLSFAVPTGAGTWEVLAFVVLRMLDGLGAAMIWPAAFGAMGDAVADHERQQAMSMLNMCYLVGIALALPIGGIVNDLTGVRWGSLILAAAVFGGIAFAIWKLIPLPKRQKPHAHLADEEAEIEVGELIQSASRIPAYLILAVVTFIGVGFPLTIIKLFAEHQFGMREAAFGALVFPAAVAMALFSVPMSRMGERLGRARAVHIGLALCALGMAVIASGAFLPVMRTPLLLAIGGIPVGVGFLLTIPAWLASVSDLNPKRRSANIGAVMTAQGVGAIIGAPIGAQMYERLQPYGEAIGLGADFGRYSPFLGCAICVAIGWLISLKLLREPHGERTDNHS
jgi:MFS transporter, DHA1 family, multidrug resistance protein